MSLLRHTFSVCPICLRRVPASLNNREDGIYLEKSCPEHGKFSSIIWRGLPSLVEWTGVLPEISEDSLGSCPHACGLCSEHKQSTCCLLLEITRRCNLECPHCFASASVRDKPVDPPLEQVLGWVADIASTGKAFLQLSGGEPTLRDDLPQIVRHARDKGCSYVQLNSNGLRLANDEAFVRELAEAGLSFVFLQFDGTTNDIYRKMRGAPLLNIKRKAIELCGKYNIGVTLVPTIVPNVNTNDIGNILRFAVQHSPFVRGVHFQPVSYFGRFPEPPSDNQRITLPEVYNAIVQQAGDLVPVGSINQSCCDHARCGFHGAYIVMPSGLHTVSKKDDGKCCSTPAPAENNRHFVGLRWQRPQNQCCCGDDKTPDLATLDGFLNRAKSHSFTISAMAFQDAHTVDLERLRQCSLHVYDNGNISPFCAYYIKNSAPSWLDHTI